MENQRCSKRFYKEKLSNIIGIQIDIIKTMAKSKLSQNRELVDFNSVKTKMLEKNKKFLYKAMINKTNTQQN